MTTLITGAGMVGSLAAARLIDEQGERPVLYDVAFPMDNLTERVPLDKVTLVRGDVTDLPDLLQAIERCKVSRIIHTAGFLTSAVRERPYAGVRVNFIGTLNVLEAARLAGVKRVVFCSSNTVYMGLKHAPSSGLLVEDLPMHIVSEYPPSVYASMKLAAEWTGHNYRDYGVEFVAVRFGGVFGPWRGLPSGGPTRLLQQLIENAWRGEPSRIGAGDIERGGMDYVYAADAAQGAVRAAVVPDLKGRVYNIAMGKQYAVPEIIQIIERLSGRKIQLDVFQAGSHSGYSNESRAGDLSRAEADLGYRVEFPMERAIADYLAWLDRQKG